MCMSDTLYLRCLRLMTQSGLTSIPAGLETPEMMQLRLAHMNHITVNLASVPGLPCLRVLLRVLLFARNKTHKRGRPGTEATDSLHVFLYII